LRIGRYEVISHLATGGMAQIYLARQTGLGSFERHVVLKTILRERATDQRFVTMFLDEAKLAATLNHQNVAQVYEVDHADGAYFMAMEYVHGENTRAILETTIRRGWTIPLELAVMIISGAAAGLHHAHERRGKNGQPLQIVHRDVSPANIMVGYDGSVKVLDFGIAKAEERATKTIGGTIKGKYGYMSPEQCKGRPIDRRSDIFALGIVLYELATLRRAFKGNDDFETMKRIVAGDLVLPSTLVAGFPRELEAIILTALANDPGARFQSAQELIEALDAFTVRAKLTGSNTAMGRFMVQLFGTKKEPWIDATLQSTDHTLVTPAELEDYEDDNDETLVVGHRDDVQRALAELNIGVRATTASPPTSATAHPLPRGAAPPAGSQLDAPLRPSPMPEHARRPSIRRSGERPALPFASSQPPAERAAAPPAAPVAAPPAAAPTNRPSNPNLAMTVIGPVPITPDAPGVPTAASVAAQVAIPSGPLSQSMMAPAPPMPAPPVAMPPATMPPTPMPMPGGSGASTPVPFALAPTLQVAPSSAQNIPVAPSGLPALVSDDISYVGAKPLVTDPKLGWSTSVNLPSAIDGTSTRLASGQVEIDYRIQSNTRWVVLAILLLLVVIAMIVLIIST
jgi:serine/threonine-protein kinase